ncbi:unnamed protein product [Closterium sp. Yama58-4]|nr:unnamed protein product [Closterium sp. Yama58-4]
MFLPHQLLVPGAPSTLAINATPSIQLPSSNHPPPCPPTKLQMTCASQGCFSSRSCKTSINQPTPAWSITIYHPTRFQPAITPPSALPTYQAPNDMCKSRLQMTCASQGCFCSRSYETSINQSTPAGSPSPFAINVTFNPPSTRHQTAQPLSPFQRQSSERQELCLYSRSCETSIHQSKPVGAPSPFTTNAISTAITPLSALPTYQAPNDMCKSRPLSTRHQTALRPAHLFSSRGYEAQVNNVASAQRAANQASTYCYPLDLHHHSPSTRHQPAINPPSNRPASLSSSRGNQVKSSTLPLLKNPRIKHQPVHTRWCSHHRSALQSSLVWRVTGVRATASARLIGKCRSLPSLLSLHRVFFRCSVSHLANPPCVFFDVSPNLYLRGFYRAFFEDFNTSPVSRTTGDLTKDAHDCFVANSKRSGRATESSSRSFRRGGFKAVKLHTRRQLCREVPDAATQHTTGQILNFVLQNSKIKPFGVADKSLHGE